MYEGVLVIFSRYWKSYGGFRSLIVSPYLHLSLLLLVLTSHFWYTEKWWEQPISVLPNLLGFSLGGLAMFLSFGDERFRSILAQTDDSSNPSPYMELCSTFVHFIVLQVAALLTALIARSLDFYWEWPSEIGKLVFVLTKFFHCGGYLLFLYSVSSILAATMAVFRTCSWYETHQRAQQDDSPVP